MNLVIDIGNTRTKVALFRNDKPIKRFSFERVQSRIIEAVLKTYRPVTNAIISDVTENQKKIVRELSGIQNVITVRKGIKLPFRNKYKSPSTLGTDRLALAAGAMKYFPGKNVLVISAGTCITYDFINSKEEYIGGSISPGLNMRFSALHHFTAQLPLVKAKKISVLTGKTTSESMLTGVINGMNYEIDGFISDYKKKYHDVKVILTGGDAGLLAGRLKNSIFAAPDLTLIGLNEILKLNVR